MTTRGRPALAVLLALVVSVAMILCTPTVAQAHADLVRAEFQGTTGAGNKPQELVLLFSESIDAALSRVQIADAAGKIVEPGPGVVSPHDPTQLTIAIRALRPGDYSAHIRVRSTSDGHISDTVLPFSLGTTIDTIGGLPPLGTPDPALESPSVAESVVRWLGLAGAALAAGGLIFALSIRRRFSDHFLSLVLAGLGLVLVGAVALLLIQAGNLAGGEPNSTFGASLSAIAGSRSGQLLIVRMGLSLLLAAGAWLATRYMRAEEIERRAGLLGGRAGPRERRAGLFVWAARGGGGLLLAGLLLTFSLSGHAAASGHPTLAAGLDWIHLAAMTVWLGGLVPLAALMTEAVSWRHRREGGTPDVRSVLEDRLPAARRFSQLALVCVVLLLLTGIYAYFIDVRHVELLPRTTYGRILLGKFVLVALLVGFGAYNRSMILPWLSQDDQRARRAARYFRWSLRGETAAGALLLATVAMLTTVAPSAGVWPEHLRLEPMQAATVDGVQLILRVSPGRIGANDIAVDVTDPGIQAASLPSNLSISVVASPSSSSTPPTERSGDRVRYQFSGYELANSGITRFAVTLNRQGQAPVKHVFAVPIGAAAAGTALAGKDDTHPPG